MLEKECDEIGIAVDWSGALFDISADILPLPLKLYRYQYSLLICKSIG